MKKAILISIVIVSSLGCFAQARVSKADSLRQAVRNEKVIRTQLRNEIKEKKKTDQEKEAEKDAKKAKENAEIHKLLDQLINIKRENDSLKKEKEKIK